MPFTDRFSNLSCRVRKLFFFVNKFILQVQSDTIFDECNWTQFFKLSCNLHLTSIKPLGTFPPLHLTKCTRWNREENIDNTERTFSIFSIISLREASVGASGRKLKISIYSVFIYLVFNLFLVIFTWTIIQISTFNWSSLWSP